MKNHEKAVREATENLKSVIAEARKAGFVVGWPTTFGGLDTIAISETAKIGAATGKSLVGVLARADGTLGEELLGEPLNLTEAELAALPALYPDVVDDPATRIAVKGKAGHRKA